jgi:hypothetical protein
VAHDDDGLDTSGAQRVDLSLDGRQTLRDREGIEVAGCDEYRYILVREADQTKPEAGKCKRLRRFPLAGCLAVGRVDNRCYPK